LTPEGQVFVLACERQQSAYELDADPDAHRSGDTEERLEARWRAGDLRLLSAERRAQVGTPEGDTVTVESLTVPDGEAVAVTLDRGGGATETVRLAVEQPSVFLRPDAVGAPTVLESAEWPWRLSALPFEGFYSARASLVYPYTLEDRNDDVGTPRIEPTAVVIASAEPIKTPAGPYIAWRVQVGDDWVAWYDAKAPHTLVALDNGVEKWVLASVE
jgi:hypothetical protein